MSHPKINTRLVPQEYVTLSWEQHATGWDVRNGKAQATGDVLSTGEVDIPMDKIYGLSDQDTMDSQFGPAFIALGTKEGWALVQAGYAVQETRGGHHRTPLLLEWLTEEGLI